MVLQPAPEVLADPLGHCDVAAEAVERLVDRPLSIALEGEGGLAAVPARLGVAHLAVEVTERAIQTIRPFA